MKTVKFLDFLYNVKSVTALDYAKIDCLNLNLLDYLDELSQFYQSFDLGLIYVNKTSADYYIIIDGINRLISVSLLLHAVCECYKKTTEKNQNAINIIRNKYLFFKKYLKLHLAGDDAIVYEKIINGERLNSKEKNNQIFLLLHRYWTKIKTDKLQAEQIFNLLKKMTISIIDVESFKIRDIYYKLNENKNLDNILLIDDYLKEVGLQKEWNNLKENQFLNKQDIKRFFKDFFITKFNYKTFSEKKIYIYFVNYFETMMQYSSEFEILSNIEKYVILYNQMLNLTMVDEDIKKKLIIIKKLDGEDTFAYILNVYIDYQEDNISHQTFIEILSTIIEFLQNRLISGNSTDFNELIEYLTAFISCK